MYRYTPTIILATLWLAVIPLSLLVPEDLLSLYWGDTRIVTFGTLLWFGFCILAFEAGAFVERSLYVDRPKSSLSLQRRAAPPVPIVYLQRSLLIARCFLALAAGVIFLRFAQTVSLVGDLNKTLLYMLLQQAEFKWDYWQITNVHGIGILAELVVSVSIFCFSALALLNRYAEEHREARSALNHEGDLSKLKSAVRHTLILSVLLQSFYLLASSERMTFVAGILGGLLSYHLLHRRLGARKVLYAFTALAFVWVFVEASRRGILGVGTLESTIDFAKNRLLLYFAAGVRNTDTFVNYIGEHSYGWYTLNFIISPLKLDEFLSLPASFHGTGSYQIRPGLGAVPPFGTAFADFGLAGFWFFIAWGFVYHRLYRLAVRRHRFLAVQIYAHMLVGLIVSFVVFLPSYSRFWVGIVGLVLINKHFTLRGRNQSSTEIRSPS